MELWTSHGGHHVRIRRVILYVIMLYQAVLMNDIGYNHYPNYSSHKSVSVVTH
jgi:hypothetical protein